MLQPITELPPFYPNQQMIQFSPNVHERNCSRHDLQIKERGVSWIQTLRNVRRMTPTEADSNKKIKQAACFLKNIPKQFSSEPWCKTLAREVVAAKLGIRSEIMSDSFERFAREHFLHRHLIRYNSHPWPVNPESVKILSKGVLKPWEEAEKDLRSVPSDPGPFNQEWHYGLQGIQNRDLYKWTVLEPFFRDDPKKWDNKYLFEVCVYVNEIPAVNGDHTWLRLYTPEGDVYSAGLYRPGKDGLFGQLEFPLREKPAAIECPDRSEFWPSDKVETLSWEITKEDFFRVKQQIEEDKKSELHFHPNIRNCTVWCLKQASLTGVYLSAEVPAVNVVSKMRYVQRVMKTSQQEKLVQVVQRMPTPIRSALEMVPTVALNTLQLCLGSSMIDKSINTPVTPLITSPLDLFRKEKTLTNYPYTLVHKGMKEVKEWRAQEKEQLRKSIETAKEADAKQLLEKMASLRYAIPQTHRAPSLRSRL